MRLIILQREILVFEAENVFHSRIQLHRGERIGPAGELFARLIEMILTGGSGMRAWSR